MIERRGPLKVLDFGLARIDAPPATTAGTQTMGLTVGTASTS